MPSPSLAKLAARPRAVTLPPATPSIDTLTAFADDDGLIRFITDANHKCSNCNARVVGTIHFNQIGELLLTAPESSAELFASHAE